MPPRLLTLLLFTLASRASSQFGNLEVKWDRTDDGSAPRPRVADEPTRHWDPPADIRRTSLAALAVPVLSGIVSGFGKTCESCVTHGHWVSRVRAACLESSPKALKAGLAARGIKCDGCNMREQYLDRLLDSVHLPVITNK